MAAQRFCKRLQVTLLEYLGVVGDVAGEYVSEGAYGRGAVVGYPTAQPGVSRQVPEKREGGQANRSKLFNQSGQRNRIGASGGYADVLLEAG